MQWMRKFQSRTVNKFQGAAAGIPYKSLVRKFDQIGHKFFWEPVRAWAMVLWRWNELKRAISTIPGCTRPTNQLIDNLSQSAPFKNVSNIQHIYPHKVAGFTAQIQKCCWHDQEWWESIRNELGQHRDRIRADQAISVQTSSRTLYPRESRGDLSDGYSVINILWFGAR